MREEQIEVILEAVKAIEAEINADRDMVNRVLYISIDGTKRFQSLPAN